MIGSSRLLRWSMFRREWNCRPDNYLAGVKLASAQIWMRANESMA
jgi:hypothetical protein